MSRARLSLFLVLLLVAANGFAAAPPPTPQELIQTHGFADVRLITNAPKVSFRMGRFVNFAIRNTDGKAKPVFLANVTQYQRAQVFGAWLPPGEYRLERLHSQTAVMNGYEVTMNVDKMLAPFKVEQGKRTDLGTLIFQPVGGSDATLIHTQSAGESAESFEQHFPVDAPALAGHEVITWNPNASWTFQRSPVTETTTFDQGLVMWAMTEIEQQKNRRVAKIQWDQAGSPTALLDMAKRATTMASGSIETADGTFYTASAIGQILRRSPDGVWTNIDTGILRDVVGLYVDGDTIAAGMEQGFVVLSRDGGATFKVVGRLPDRGIVFGIHRLGAERWAIASQTAAAKIITTHIYFTSALDSLPAAPAKTFTQDPLKKFLGSVPVAPAVISQGRTHYFVTLPPKTRATYDMEKDEWSEFQAKKSLGQLFPDNARTLLLTYDPPGISLDDGVTWTPFTWPGLFPTAVMLDNKRGIALVVQRTIMQQKQAILMTSDGGVTWSGPTREFTGALCNFILASQKTEQYFCMMDEGSIISTKDGVTWTLERAVN